MSERVSSLLILLGVTLAVLALWVLSVMAVRWDTRRRQLTEMERQVWMALAIALPLFGFAVYLAMRVLRRYLTPSEPSVVEDERMTSVKPRIPAWRDVPQQEPANFSEPLPAWGNPPAQPGANGGQVRRTASTVAAPYKPIQVTFAFVVLEGPHMGQQFTLDHLPARVGRGPDASISLDDDLNVSRKHAEVYEWNGALRIRDLHSTHGTLINDQPVIDQSIQPGDRIQVGSTVFILREVT